jgi:hypothetical protein
MQSIILIILITIFGSLIVKVLIKELKPLLVMSTGFLIGLGLLTFILFAISWIGIRITNLSIWSSVIFMLFATSIPFYLLKRKINFDKLKLLRIESAGLLLIAFILALSFLLSVYFPITAWDALALYDFRAKVIADAGYFVQISKNYNYFSHYPLHTSLTHTIIYLTGNLNPQFIYSIYLLVFSVIFYMFLKALTKKNIALISTILLITTPDIFEHSTLAYTNLPYTVLYVSGIIYLFFAFLKENDGYLMISSLLIALSTWVRSDLPFWLTGILFALFYSIKSRRIRPFLLYLIPFMIIQQTWNRFASMSFGNGYSTSGQLSEAGTSLLKNLDISRFFEICSYLYVNIISNWGPLLVLFVICMIVNIFKKRTSSIILLAIIIVNLVGLFVGTYVFSFKVAEWKEIADSAARMSMFFPPLIIFYSSLVISDNI